MNDFLQGLWFNQIQSLSGLFIVSTPIGHLEDITLRALTTFASVDGILCEDTRITRLLLAHYAISTPCYSYHSYNEKQKLKGILNLLQKGSKLALVSDRGTPLISDPGFLLVTECYKHNISVHAVPGASSVMTAAVLSAFSCSTFFFQGFLPTKKRSQTLEFLASLSSPVIVFESPHKLYKTLEEIESFFGNRSVCLMRELTKKFEERIVRPIPELKQWAKEASHIGECVLIIKGIS